MLTISDFLCGPETLISQAKALFPPRTPTNALTHAGTRARLQTCMHTRTCARVQRSRARACHHTCPFTFLRSALPTTAPSRPRTVPNADIALHARSQSGVWEPAQIHTDKVPASVTDPVERQLLGSGFPGARLQVDARFNELVRKCLRHPVRTAWPHFSFEGLAEEAHSFGLMTTAHQPQRKWLHGQRVPHNDIDWSKQGVRTDRRGSVPGVVVSVYALTDQWGHTGTQVCRTTGTKASLRARSPLRPCASARSPSLT